MPLRPLEAVNAYGAPYRPGASDSRIAGQTEVQLRAALQPASPAHFSPAAWLSPPKSQPAKLRGARVGLSKRVFAPAGPATNGAKPGTFGVSDHLSRGRISVDRGGTAFTNPEGRA